MTKYKISITGAGPGNPDLLTLRAEKRIKAAEILLYDSLVPDEIIELTGKNCLKKNVGKLFRDGQDQELRQQKIHQLMAKYYAEGKRVVRLKSGDPMIFGRGMEELRYLDKNNIPWEIIPGITAANAAAASFAIPLTERGISRSTLLTSGYTHNGELPDTSSAIKTLNEGGTVVFYMALSKITDLINILKKNNLSGCVNILIANKVSQTEERLIRCNCNTIIESLKKENLSGPSLIIIGKNI